VRRSKLRKVVDTSEQDAGRIKSFKLAFAL
jgi:hypothetical protein